MPLVGIIAGSRVESGRSQRRIGESSRPSIGPNHSQCLADRPEFLSREEKRSSSATNLKLTAGSTREARRRKNTFKPKPSSLKLQEFMDGRRRWSIRHQIDRG